MHYFLLLSQFFKQGQMNTNVVLINVNVSKIQRANELGPRKLLFHKCYNHADKIPSHLEGIFNLNIDYSIYLKSSLIIPT